MSLRRAIALIVLLLDAWFFGLSTLSILLLALAPLDLVQESRMRHGCGRASVPGWRRWRGALYRIASPAMYRTLGLCLPVHLPTTNAKRPICRLIGEVICELSTNGQWQGTRLPPGPKA
ncbi:hypothetical protein [Acidovorax sp. A1169]|uniref:hypothetical protein n=1 Tax=Acidovorax sp. A1169 TaxID=3059524 RepID=UPI002738011B|nr:hypothetical protein [Acidovorax sp. A1169]MDP4077475.1 hypothetical protein [Acidovorax sp. A1169]